MIDPAKVCLFVPPELKKFKQELFNAIGDKIEKLGGKTIRTDWRKLDDLPNDILPIIGCGVAYRGLFDKWLANGRPWIYWDRGYARRVFASWLPHAATREDSYYRWHLNAVQMKRVRDVPSDRWDFLETPLAPWKKNPDGHVVVAMPSPTYQEFFKIKGWTEKTLRDVTRYAPTRRIVVRDKESKVPLAKDLDGALCMVTHGSNAAVEAVIMGCPVVVDRSSAAALVGLVDLSHLEKPIYPDRTKWAYSLAYCQFNEHELVDGTLWKLME